MFFPFYYSYNGIPIGDVPHDRQVHLKVLQFDMRLLGGKYFYCRKRINADGYLRPEIW